MQKARASSQLGGQEGAVIRALFVLQSLPGALGRGFGRMLGRHLDQRARRQFYDCLADLGPGDLMLNIGAKSADCLREMAASGAEIHAVVGDSPTHESLRAATADLANVTCHALSLTPAPRRASAVTPQSRRFEDFLAQFDRAPRLVVIDLPEVEVDLLLALAGAELVLPAELILVATHERENPGHWPILRELRRTFRDWKAPQVALFWAEGAR